MDSCRFQLYLYALSSTYKKTTQEGKITALISSRELSLSREALNVSQTSLMQNLLGVSDDASYHREVFDL
jgi:hypothetical protein